jgi:hypothetical protein
MACGSCGGGGTVNLGPSSPYVRGKGDDRTLYQVLLNTGAEGGETIVFQTHDADLARKVSGNYPGSVLRPDPDAAVAAAATEAEAESPVSEASEPVKTSARKAADKT